MRNSNDWQRLAARLRQPSVDPTRSATIHTYPGPVAPPEGGGSSPRLWVDVQKLCNMCVHCSKCVSFWGTSYSRPPIDPYFTPPPVTKSWRRHCPGPPREGWNECGPPWPTGWTTRGWSRRLCSERLSSTLLRMEHWEATMRNSNDWQRLAARHSTQQCLGRHASLNLRYYSTKTLTQHIYSCHLVNWRDGRLEKKVKVALPSVWFRTGADPGSWQSACRWRES